MKKEQAEALLILDRKERMLEEIVVWLKARGLWEECRNDLMTKIESEEEILEHPEAP
jgi:hypothetical protein